MGLGTSIQWTDHSWPVVNGCRRVSAGCENCYAERLIATRLSKTPKYQGLAVFGEHGPRWTGETRLWREHLDMPLTVKKPSKFFVADMGDLFYEKVSDADISAVFGVMAECSEHTFQVLTKRPKRISRWMARAESAHPAGLLHEIAYRAKVALNVDSSIIERSFTWPLPNVWLGVSVEDQNTADDRISVLLDTPAAVRFVSYEPALGPVDWFAFLKGETRDRSLAALRSPPMPGLDWIIVGGESGPHARPFHAEWARTTIRQARDAGTAVFVKQMGSQLWDATLASPLPNRIALRDRKGGDMTEWLPELRVREFPRLESA